METVACVNILLALLFSPLLLGVINRVKAFFAGRQGLPVFQLYSDLGKLFQKGAVYSRTTTWIFCAGPVVGLAALLIAATLVPQGGSPALFGFNGDVIFLIYLLGLLRFFTVLAALDT